MMTFDDLLSGRLKIAQPRRGPKVNMDTVMLAGFTRLKPRERALELGCATGAAALILAWRTGGQITGLDIQPRLIELAGHNAQANGLAERLFFAAGDLRDLAVIGSLGAFDVVLVNPPYEEPGEGQPCATAEDRLARQGTACTLRQVCAAAARALKDKGRFYLVMRARRLTDTLVAARVAGLEPSALRFVHPKAERPASVFLMEARRRGGRGLRVLPPLVMYEPSGTYTAEFARFYEKEAPTCPSS